MSEQIPAPSRTVFQRVAQLAKYPDIAGVGAGKTAWEAFTERSTPADRRPVLDALVPGFTEPLLATRAAEDRFASWCSLGRPVLSHRAIERELTVIGLGLARVRRMIESALCKMPPCVSSFATRCVWFVGCGRGLAGWRLQPPPIPAGEWQLVGLDAKASLDYLWSVAAHEVAHAWLMAVAPPGNVPTLRERERAQDFPKQLAARWRRWDLLANEIERDARIAERDERLAARLVASWGFSGPPADAELCAQTARAAAMRSRT